MGLESFRLDDIYFIQGTFQTSDELMTLCIVGGGVAGLAAAHYALKAPDVKRIVLLESSKRLGGWIDTVR